MSVSSQGEQLGNYENKLLVDEGGGDSVTKVDYAMKE